MLWINFLHLYQPATADDHTIKEATEKSYLRIIRALEEHPRVKFTLNINGCLIERWQELSYSSLIKRVNRLIEKKQIELTGTAFYHPILPLVPEEEAVKQIKEQEKILKKHFGKNLPLRGFFFPEMAYGQEAGKLIKRLGYQWIIAGELSYNGRLNQVDFSKICQDKKNKLKVIFRSRNLSRSYVPDELIKIIKKEGNDKKIIITATDGELYGLKHNDPTAEFEKLLGLNKLRTQTISEFIGGQKDTIKIEIIPGNWESTEQELKNNLPYALWFNKKNKIQSKLWRFAKFAYDVIGRHFKDKNYYWARWHLSRGLSSCTFWWASARDFRHVFGPLAWGPDEIEKGLSELIRSIRALDKTTTRQTKIKAEKIYLNIKHMIWRKHWTCHWKKQA